MKSLKTGKLAPNNHRIRCQNLFVANQTLGTPRATLKERWCLHFGTAFIKKMTIFLSSTATGYTIYTKIPTRNFFHKAEVNLNRNLPFLLHFHFISGRCLHLPTTLQYQRNHLTLAMPCPNNNLPIWQLVDNNTLDFYCFRLHDEDEKTRFERRMRFSCEFNRRYAIPRIAKTRRRGYSSSGVSNWISGVFIYSVCNWWNKVLPGQVETSIWEQVRALRMA